MASENEKRSRIAATMTRMLDEAKAHGLDDKFAIKAVHDYGVDNGQDFKESMVDPHDMKEFADKFTDNLEANVYEMETVKSTEDDFRVHFHYCPYVNRWLRMGKTTDEMANLCDICMKGDRAVAENLMILILTLAVLLPRETRIAKFVILRPVKLKNNGGLLSMTISLAIRNDDLKRTWPY